jgi:hypothetical protein
VDTLPALLVWSAIAIAVFLLYFFPAIVASCRKHHNYSAILALNFLLGWTFLGWIASLVWALTAVQALTPVQAVRRVRDEDDEEECDCMAKRCVCAVGGRAR